MTPCCSFMIPIANRVAGESCFTFSPNFLLRRLSLLVSFLTLLCLPQVPCSISNDDFTSPVSSSSPTPPATPVIMGANSHNYNNNNNQNDVQNDPSFQNQYYPGRFPHQEEAHRTSWSSRVVTTKLGLTRGFIFTPRGYEGVEVFLGLPYASSPVGSLRLMPPVSGSPWSGTKMNDQPSPVCPQVFPLPLLRKQWHNNMGSVGGESKPSESEKDDDGESAEDLIDTHHSIGPGNSNNNNNNIGGGESSSESDIGEEDVLGEFNETEVLRTMSRGRLTQLKRLAPFLTNQSEDCLYLNIYVPLSVSEGKVKEPVPVLVFIHGEDFSYGAGHPYDPSMLVSQGHVIVITFNFRLGILGFLNANSDGYFKSPANFALLDQLAALHWVQENIGAFGGEKRNVTLMGHGKGAMFVNFLMISNALPSSELLFHRVILMSGSALSPFTVGLSYGKDLAKRFAERFKCPLEPPSNMLQCLRQLPLQYFLDSELWKYFGPSDDGIVIESGIRENILRDRISRFPMIFGVTKAEFLPRFSENDAVYGIEAEKRREILKQFIDGFYSSYRSEILAAAIHEYTDWERPVQHPISVRDETLDALGDAQIVAPLVKVGELHSQGSSRTYFYVFDYQSKVSDFVQRLGCVPGEDLTYVFGVPLYLSSANANSAFTSTSSSSSPAEHHATNEQSLLLSQPPEWRGGTAVKSSGRGGASLSSQLQLEGKRLGAFSGNFSRNEVQLSLTLLHHWANFIRTGNPNNAESSSSPLLSQGEGESRALLAHDQQDKGSSLSQLTKPKLIEWPSYDLLFKKYLSIEAKPRVRNHYRAHKLSFWLHLVPELMRNGGSGDLGRPSFGDGQPAPPFPSNSTMQHPPSTQLVGPPYWEQHPFYYASGNFSSSSNPGEDISGALGSRPPHFHHRFPHNHEGGGGGLQIYSTALSVTIAVGCSLLILNFLFFVTCYYWKDKRRGGGAMGRRGSSSDSPEHHRTNNYPPTENEPSGLNEPLDLQLSTFPQERFHQTSNAAESVTLPSIHNTPVRHKENGQVVNLLQQNCHSSMSHSHPSSVMPNIIEDLQHQQPPTSSSSSLGGLTLPNLRQLLLETAPSGDNGDPNNHYQIHKNPHTSTLPSSSSHHHHQFQHANPNPNPFPTLPSSSGKKQGQAGYELSMPDAILAAAMMLNYRQSNSPQDLYTPSLKSLSRKGAPSQQPQQQLYPPSLGGLAYSNGGGESGGVYSHAELQDVVKLQQLLQQQQQSSRCSSKNSNKRTTPSVKFSPDTFVSSPSITMMAPSQSTPSSAPVDVSSPSYLTSTTTLAAAPTPSLKSSLKKHSNYSSSSSSGVESFVGSTNNGQPGREDVNL